MKKVFIVGGPGVVGPEVEEQLNAIGISTERFYGADRTATSIVVAGQIGTSNGIILTTDSDYTDTSLSAAPIAAKLQIPIILMPKDSVPDSVSNFISGKNISKTYILGDENLISDSVASQFPNVQRISGMDKYDKNINIINTFKDKFDFSNVCLAYSETFADALSGSAFSALNGNPIVLVGDYPSKYTKDFFKDEKDKISKVTIFGGTAGIKDYEVGDIISGNSNLQLDYIKNNSIYNFVMKDENGVGYTAYVYSDDSQSAVAAYDSSVDWGYVWAGASEGDKLCHGHFKIAYIKDGSDDITVSNLKNFISQDDIYCFNTNANLVRNVENKFTGYPDFLIVGQTIGTNDSLINIYCIKNGNLQLVNIYDSDKVYTGFDTSTGQNPFFRQASEDTFITSVYDNDDQNSGYDVNTYEFNKDTCSFKFLNKKHMSTEEYNNLYQ